jgi:taurine dioxygenase
MLTIEPTGAWGHSAGPGPGAAARRKRRGEFLLALGRHGVLRFPEQQLDFASLKRFSELFGEIQGNPIRDADPAREYSEIGVLSN